MDRWWRSAWLQSAGVTVAIFIAFLAVWYIVPPLLKVPKFILPGPVEVGREFVAAAQADLFRHTWITFIEVVIGFVVGSALGAGIGYLLSQSESLEFYLSPYLLALQISPKIAFAPLFILWLGFGMSPKILTAVLVVFFPILVNVLVAVRVVDRDLIQLLRALNATRWQIFWTVQFPSSLPSLFSGLRIGATLAVIGVIVGELVGANIGLGYLLNFAEGQALTGLVLVTIIMLTIVGIFFYLAVLAVEKVVLRWYPSAAVEAEAMRVPQTVG